MGKLIGIDLGTTNSCVAVMENGAPQVIPYLNGVRTPCSLMGFTAEGERLFGCCPAREQAATNPKNTIAAVKRLMGRKYDSPEVEQWRRYLLYDLVRGPNGDAHVQIGDKSYSPAEISASILLGLKKAAEDYLGEPVHEAVITVPACFNDAQRRATRDAGIIAGFTTVHLLNEPTATALAYGLRNAKRQFVAVYDMGGGTFDVTVLEMSYGIFQVRATAGDACLGGIDFDQRITDWLVGEFQSEHGIDLSRDPAALQRVREAAERAKRELNTSRQADVALPFTSADDRGPGHLSAVLSRQKYEELTADLMARTEYLCRQCLADAHLRPDQVDEVLLVGGQTRAPKVAEVVWSVFAKGPNRAVNLDEGVAMGAAIQAGIIAGEVRDTGVRDVTPHTLGIETKDGTFTPLIERNTPLPARRSRVFTTVSDNQSRVEVHVLQGEGNMAAHNWSLAKFELTGIPPAPRGVPPIEVTFEIDANGIVSIGAQDQATGRSQSITVHLSRTREQQVQLTKEAERVECQLEGRAAALLRSAKDLGSRLAPDERERVFAAVERAKKALLDGATKASHLWQIIAAFASAMVRPDPGRRRGPGKTAGTKIGGRLMARARKPDMPEDEATVRYLTEEERQQMENVSVVQEMYRRSHLHRQYHHLDPTRQFPEEATLYLDTTSPYHEAAHAVVILTLGGTVQLVTLDPAEAQRLLQAPASAVRAAATFGTYDPRARAAVAIAGILQDAEHGAPGLTPPGSAAAALFTLARQAAPSDYQSFLAACRTEEEQRWATEAARWILRYRQPAVVTLGDALRRAGRLEGPEVHALVRPGSGWVGGPLGPPRASSPDPQAHRVVPGWSGDSPINLSPSAAGASPTINLPRVGLALVIALMLLYSLLVR